MSVMTTSGIRYMLDNVFNYVPAEEAVDGDEFWWIPTHNRDGWIVAWMVKGRLETLHTYHYPPNMWGGLDRYPTELTGPASL